MYFRICSKQSTQRLVELRKKWPKRNLLWRELLSELGLLVKFSFFFITVVSCVYVNTSLRCACIVYYFFFLSSRVLWMFDAQETVSMKYRQCSFLNSLFGVFFAFELLLMWFLLCSLWLLLSWFLQRRKCTRSLWTTLFWTEGSAENGRWSTSQGTVG